jgi:hypothetical protein
MKSKKRKTKIKYTDEPIGDAEIIKDFLPPSAQLVFHKKKIAVKVKLKKSNIIS